MRKLKYKEIVRPIRKSEVHAKLAQNLKTEKRMGDWKKDQRIEEAGRETARVKRY